MTLARMVRQAMANTAAYSPTATAQAATERYSGRMNERLARGLTTGRSKARTPVCPARAYARHPDASLRKLARAQSAEAHILNDIIAHGEVHPGRCPGKACRSRAWLPQSLFAKNDHTLRIALGRKRQARINERGW